MPPSGEPIKEQILQDIETTLLTVVAGASYYHTIHKVYRIQQAPTTLTSFPSVLLVPGATSYDGESIRLQKRIVGSFTILVSGYVRSGSDLARDIERLTRDIHTALFIDITRGGAAINTRVVSDEPFYPTHESDPEGGVDITVDVDFRTSRTDLNVNT